MLLSEYLHLFVVFHSKQEELKEDFCGWKRELAVCVLNMLLFRDISSSSSSSVKFPAV